MTGPVETLQQVLAAEHAAVRVLGVWGARTSRSRSPEESTLLDERYRAHRAHRDAWEAWLRQQGATPAPAAAEYRVPTEGQDVAAAASAVEATCATHYAALVAVTTGELRLLAATALEGAAVAQVQWGAPATHFPGAPEL